MPYRSYSAAEYRKAGIGAGPFALEGNPNTNFNKSRPGSILGIVMHITAGLSDYTLPDTSAEGTTRYGMTTATQASWHSCIDSDGIIPSVRDEWTAWQAGVSSVNGRTLGIEQGTGDTNWNRKPADWVDRTIRNVAVWCAPRVIKYKIPLVVVYSLSAVNTAIQQNRPFGFVGHSVIRPATRTDPGMVNGVDTYPWALLFKYIKEEIALLVGGPVATTTKTTVTVRQNPSERYDEIVVTAATTPANAGKHTFEWYDGSKWAVFATNDTANGTSNIEHRFGGTHPIRTRFTPKDTSKFSASTSPSVGIETVSLREVLDAIEALGNRVTKLETPPA